jgi:hypothetical protein
LATCCDRAVGCRSADGCNRGRHCDSADDLLCIGVKERAMRGRAAAVLQIREMFRHLGTTNICCSISAAVLDDGSTPRPRCLLFSASNGQQRNIATVIAASPLFRP